MGLIIRLKQLIKRRAPILARVWWKLLTTKREIIQYRLYPIIDHIQIQRFNKRLKHLYGPKNIKYDIDEAIVLCLLKDAELSIKSFIEHYTSKGFKHIVLLDNMSSDKTIEIARRYPNVSIFQTDMPFKENKYFMRRFLANRFAKSRWSLLVDSDELFDYPYSDKISLRELLQYLNRESYTAVISHMLDMFSDRTLMQTKSAREDNIQEQNRYYDLDDIEKSDYYDYPLVKKYSKNNVLSNKNIKLIRGGIRKKVFGLDKIWLSKHPLILNDKKIKPFLNSHICNNAQVADFSCVLLHYKFLSDFKEKVKDAVKKKNYVNNSFEYKKYETVLIDDPDITIKQDTSKKLESVNQLVDEGFLVVSDQYKELAEKRKYL